MQPFQENRDHADLRCGLPAAQSVEKVVRIESAPRNPSNKIQIMSGTLQTRVMVISDRERLGGENFKSSSPNLQVCALFL